MKIFKNLVSRIRKIEFEFTHVDRIFVSGVVTIFLGLLIFLYRFEPELSRFLLDTLQLILLLYIWANLKDPFSQ